MARFTSPIRRSPLMLLLTALTLLLMSLGLWLFTPVLVALTPLLSLAWLGWGALLLGLWLFAAPSTDDSSADPQATRRAGHGSFARVQKKS